MQKARTLQGRGGTVKRRKLVNRGWKLRCEKLKKIDRWNRIEMESPPMFIKENIGKTLEGKG
ncbi:hypothetical protein CR513_44643, partial [Mucuna pruriens]